MRLITWNCNMAFRKKANRILEYEPDILIIQESENINKINIDDFIIKPKQSFWFGDNDNKGISIFNFSSIKMEQIEIPFENNKWIIPFKLFGKEELILFAVWAMNHRGNKIINKVRPAYRTFKTLEKYFNKNVIILGDFNNNKIWDNKSTNIGSFSDIVNLYKSHDILSCYHTYFNEDFGEETTKTLVWRKNLSTTYHVDYCFTSKNIMKVMDKIYVGKFEEWMDISDHVPMIIDFDI